MKQSGFGPLNVGALFGYVPIYLQNCAYKGMTIALAVTAFKCS